MVGGTLDEFGLRDLIQVYCTTRQTARLTLGYADGKAHLYFAHGELVHADFGPLSGRSAVTAAFARTGGEFHVDIGVQAPERSITEAWTAIVLEGLPGARPRPAALPRTADDPPTPAATPRIEAAPRPSAAALPQPPRPVTPSRPVGPAAPAAAPPPTPLHAAPSSGFTPSRASGATPRLVEREAAMIPALEPPRLSRNPGSAARHTPPPLVPPAPSRVPRLIGIAAVIVVAAAGAVWYFRSGTALPGGSPKTVSRPKDPTILLGMSAAMTGPAKELGRQMKLGVETCLNAVNDSGGIHGHKFQLVALDDGYEPDRTKATMKELVEDRKVFAIVGNVGTPTAEVALPYVLEKKIPFVGAFTGAGILRKEPPDRYVFNYRASYVEETSAVVRYLVELRKIRPNQIAVFAQQDGFGDAGFAGVTRALRKYGRDKDQIPRVGFKRNTLEIGDAVDAILKMRNTIKAVVMVAPYRPAARFIEKLKEQKFDPIFTNVSFVGSTALAEELRQLGPSYANGVIVTQVVPPVDSSATAAIRYRDALQKYFRGEKPDFVSLEGYLAANILMEGFRKAGKDPTPETLVDALESIHGLDLGIGTAITFGLSEHQGSHKVWGTVLDEGATFHLFDLE